MQPFSEWLMEAKRPNLQLWKEFFSLMRVAERGVKKLKGSAFEGDEHSNYMSIDLAKVKMNIPSYVFYDYFDPDSEIDRGTVDRSAETAVSPNGQMQMSFGGGKVVFEARSGTVASQIVEWLPDLKTLAKAAPKAPDPTKPAAVAKVVKPVLAEIFARGKMSAPTARTLTVLSGGMVVRYESKVNAQTDLRDGIEKAFRGFRKTADDRDGETFYVEYESPDREMKITAREQFADRAAAAVTVTFSTRSTPVAEWIQANAS